jgi:uncharacterized MAPEG superfamily protein
MEGQPLLQSQLREGTYKAATTAESVPKQESNTTMPTAIDHMNSYKGQSAPNPLIPISGILLGIISPCIIYTLLNNGNKMISLTDPAAGVDNVVILLQSMVLVAGLFFSEFIFGAIARSKSPKAGFSPAAAQASGNQPFELIEANRIHQNQIESACIYIPAALSAAAAGVNSNLLIGTTVTWVLGRLVYRYGYCQRDFPLWRLVGLEVSLTQSLICFGFFAYVKFKSN